VHSGDVRVDVQSALAMLAPSWGLKPLLDISDEQARDDLAAPSVMALSFVAQSARGITSRWSPSARSTRRSTIVERFMIRWRGEPDPRHVEAVDAYFVSAAEHGMNASTFTARVIASTGADVPRACRARSARCPGRCTAVRRRGCCTCSRRWSRPATPGRTSAACSDRGERLMGFGHRVYRAEDPRARVLRRTAKALGAPRAEVAEALEQAALEELHARRPDRVLATNVEFWAAVILDFAEVPPTMFTPMFTCARTAGWAAHVLEQKRTGRLIRPPRATSARRAGPPEDVAGWDGAVRAGYAG
jgi:citrate synthase